MRTLAIVGTLLFLAAGSAAQAQPDQGRCPVRASGESDAAYLQRVKDDRCACPVKYRDETQIAFLVRTRPVCEARWQEKVTAGTTGTETHEHFLERCGRACAAVIPGPTPAANAQYIPGGAALALIVAGGAFAALSSDDKPASP